MEEQENQMNIELSEDIALGVYSNLAVITHSPAEIVCDFIQIMPGMPKGKVRSRILMTPQNAKRFLNALADNIQNYEKSFEYCQAYAARVCKSRGTITHRSCIIFTCVEGIGRIRHYF